MGKDTPYIMEGDGEADIHSHIIQLLGLDWWDFINDKTILNREFLELNIQNVLKVVNDPSEDPGYFLILGYYILKTGASISDELKKKIADATKWEYEETIYPNKKMEEERKIVLKDLRDKILDHKPGRITRLIEDGGGFAPKLLVQKKKLVNLIEKGYSFQQLKEFFAKEGSENISKEDLIENIKWHFHIKSNNSSEKIFKQVQRKVLKEKLKGYIGKGVRTLEEMNQKFISPKNPNGIHIEELEELVKYCLSVKSWEEAITKYGFPTNGWMDTYIEQVCGIDTEKITEKEEIITRKMVEDHFDELIEMIQRWANPEGYFKLGWIILKTGAKLPEKVRRDIIKFTNSLFDYEDIDEELLRVFQDKIRTHKSGRKNEELTKIFYGIDPE